MTHSIALSSDLSVLRLLRFDRATRAVDTPRTLKHIFVIAGPSGSGKSTLMGEFVKDRLPDAIAGDLPRESKTWRRTSGNELSRKGLKGVLSTKGPIEGLVVHYDIMRAFSRGFGQYSNDPAMREVAEADAALTVLTILPPREILFEQFLRRARSGEYEEWWDRKRLRRQLKTKFREIFYRVARRSPRLLKEGHLSLLEVYGSDRALDRWTYRWETYLDSVRAGRDDVRLVYVAPEPVTGDTRSFRLLRRV